MQAAAWPLAASPVARASARGRRGRAAAPAAGRPGGGGRPGVRRPPRATAPARPPRRPRTSARLQGCRTRESPSALEGCGGCLAASRQQAARYSACQARSGSHLPSGENARQPTARACQCSVLTGGCTGWASRGTVRSAQAAQSRTSPMRASFVCAHPAPARPPPPPPCCAPLPAPTARAFAFLPSTPARPRAPAPGSQRAARWARPARRRATAGCGRWRRPPPPPSRPVTAPRTAGQGGKGRLHVSHAG
jgi:hypothetical protein